MTDRLPDVPMRQIPVRMGEDAYEQIKRAAEDAEVSFSQYMREAALARVWFNVGLAGGDTADLARVLLAIARAADAEGADLNEYVARLLRSSP